MAYHFGMVAPASDLFIIPDTPGNALMADPIPPIYDDVYHLNGYALESRNSLDKRKRRAVWTASTGEMARLIARRR